MALADFTEEVRKTLSIIKKKHCPLWGGVGGDVLRIIILK
jgi:hypothetical protein